jgi:hypothetical protein
VVFKIAIVRFPLGIATGIGTVVAMSFPAYTLVGFGILFMMVGLNIMLYAPIMKVHPMNDIAHN